MVKISEGYTEFQQYIRGKYRQYIFDNSKEDDEEMEDYLLLMNAPEQYQNEPQMFEYAKAHPNATVHELVEYWDEITPDGLAPGDDGADLLDDEDDE